MIVVASLRENKGKLVARESGLFKPSHSVAEWTERLVSLASEGAGGNEKEICGWGACLGRAYAANHMLC